MVDVVLIRPGCTDFDEQHRIQGALDLPLNSRGQEQIAGIVKRLSEMDLELIYASPCEPARSTANTLGAELGIRVKEIDELRNLNHGLWQGLLVDDVRRKYPKVFKQWQESPETICPPQGETVPDAVSRIRKALAKPLRKHKKPIGIVASEPLATLIACVVCDRTPELPDPLRCGEHTSLVEVLSESQNGNGASPRPLNGADSRKNGHVEKEAEAPAQGGDFA